MAGDARKIVLKSHNIFKSAVKSARHDTEQSIILYRELDEEIQERKREYAKNKFKADDKEKAEKNMKYMPTNSIGHRLRKFFGI